MKWKGQFVQSLSKVLYSVHPQFSADQESLVYVESLLIKLLSMITAKPVPSTVSDVEVSDYYFAFLQFVLFFNPCRFPQWGTKR